MYVFIDTNIYLNFYHYSQDDLEELKKLHVAITSGPIDLIITDQLKDEFARNRENKIADALRQFNEHKMPRKFPQLFKDYPEYADIRESIKSFDIAADAITKRLNAGIHAKTLLADDEVQFLFEHSVNLETSDEILQKARLRRELRKPPGKVNSIGDAINWEALLSYVPEGENVYLVSGDVDYRSSLNPKQLAEYLREEWEINKKSKIYYFDRLFDFFASQYPDIKLASELERKINVTNLVSSGGFLTTHRSIGRLNVSDLTEAEGLDLLKSFLEKMIRYTGSPETTTLMNLRMNYILVLIICLAKQSKTNFMVFMSLKKRNLQKR
jgi:predicted nucleic acid-binding protein